MDVSWNVAARNRKLTAKEFADKWADRGYEKGDTGSFWLELLGDVIGMEDVTSNVHFEHRTSKKGFVDVIVPDAKTFIEQKSLGVDLDRPEERQGRLVTPFEQAKAYADSMPNSQRPDTIIVCNFETFRIHSLESEDPANEYVEFQLSELPEQIYLLDFLIDPQHSRRKREEKVSLDAGALIGKIYEMLRGQYHDPDTPESQHSLNVLCVRLVFCLFAEDAEIFPKDAFYNYLQGLPARQVRVALKELFRYLDTKPEDRDPYVSEELKRFPYVNGGLFAQDVEIPQFTEEILGVLLNEVSEGTNWSQISPTIFGGVFESTLNPETRRSGGMHYTSPENIHKVIDPLFLDDLKGELAGILNDSSLGERARRNRLEKYHDKLASLTFFDPACGSGNFLSETYISLRRLETKVLSELSHGQTSMVFDESHSPLKVSLSQFHGIEINDFAVQVSNTALWIAELQANAEAQVVVTQDIEDLPLKDNARVTRANALRVDWADILPAKECNYIIGNPPFIGYSNHSPEQKKDRAELFGKGGGVLDYVACWYKKAADYMQGTHIRAALVSTNSICQGQQVTPLWRPLFDQGIRFNFAHRSFVWGNEAEDQAHVHVVIIGFSYDDVTPKYLFAYPKGEKEIRRQVSHINGYLAEAPDVFVDKQTKPLSDVPAMAQGFKPADGQNLLLTSEQKDELLAKEPQAEKWVRPFSMGAEFIKGVDRYCLWLPEITGAELQKVPEIRKHVDACREWRLQQTPTGDAFKLADRPHLLRPCGKFKDGTYIGFPVVSSERRKYVPIAFVDSGMIPGNKLYFIPTDEIYYFGVLTSKFHNAWMRTVAGRLKSDYNYGNTTVYNTLVWPSPTPAQRNEIESAATAVLEAREKYSPATLADLYDPDNDWLYPELTAAHKRLDRAVEAAYNVDFDGDETAIVAHLFSLYAKATAE